MATTNTSANLQVGLWQAGKGAVYFAGEKSSLGNSPALRAALPQAEQVAFTCPEGNFPDQETLDGQAMLVRCSRAAQKFGRVAYSEIQEYNKNLIGRLSAHPRIAELRALADKDPHKAFFPLLSAHVGKVGAGFGQAVRNLKGEVATKGKRIVSISLDTKNQEELLDICLCESVQPSFALAVQQLLGSQASGTEADALKALCQESAAQKAALFLQGNPRALIVADQTEFQAMMTALAERKIDVVPPKRGFLWEMKKADRVVGYLFGTPSIIAQDAVRSLSPKIIGAVDSCDTLGMPLDPAKGSGENSPTSSSREIQNFERALVERGLRGVGAQLVASDHETFIEQGMQKIAAAWGLAGIDRFLSGKASQRQLQVVEWGPSPSVVSLIFDREELTAFAGSNFRADEIAELHKHIEGVHQCQRAAITELFTAGSTEALEAKVSRIPQNTRSAIEAQSREIAAKIDTLVSSGKKPFASADLFHFAGTKSLVEMMKDRGYEVEQVGY